MTCEWKPSQMIDYRLFQPTDFTNLDHGYVFGITLWGMVGHYLCVIVGGSLLVGHFWWVIVGRSLLVGHDWG